MTDQPPSEWFSEFFESPDSLPLSFFPTENETDAEVTGLERLLGLRTEWRIADLCCGAGRHLVRLAERGYQVAGLDLSAMMLALARQEANRRGSARAPQEGPPGWPQAGPYPACGPAPSGPRLLLIRADARCLPFRDGCLDVALNLFNSFGYCATDEENEQVLRETARVLKPGGQFLLETRNPQYQILFAPVRQEVRAADGSRLIVAWRYDRENKRLTSEWRRPHTDRVVYTASMRLYQLEELRGMMERAGLEETGLFGGYGGEEFAGWERVVVWRGRRRGGS